MDNRTRHAPVNACPGVGVADGWAQGAEPPPPSVPTVKYLSLIFV